MTGSPTTAKLSPLRRVIASRMVASKQDIPHYRVAIDVELDRLLVARREHNRHISGAKVSLNDCFIKACGEILLQHPQFNVQLIEGQLHHFSDADISFVVAIPGGLSTPVVRRVNRKSIDEIAEEAASFVDQARSGRLRMEAIEGGTFTISNLGGSGVDAFDAIINLPQCAILAVASAKASVLPCPAHGVRTAEIARLTLSLDHRVLDGTEAADFLNSLKLRLEDPRSLFSTPTPS